MAKLRKRAFDEAWKKVLEDYFGEFLDFYFPKISCQIDKSKGYKFLEQELQKIIPKAKVQTRRIDKLAEVYVPGQGEVWILVHVEIQTHPDMEFAFRMFTYHYRIFDRHRKPVASLAILADASPTFRPHCFEIKAFGEVYMRFEFNTNKILDFSGKEEVLNHSRYPNNLLS